MFTARLSRLRGIGQAFLQRLGAHHCLPRRVTSHDPELLVLHVIDAQRIAVAQQDVLPVQLDRLGVVEDRHAGLVSELLPDHEVSIAVHEKNGHARIGN